MTHCNRKYLKQEESSDSGISQAVTWDKSRCQCWGPIGNKPILGKRHDVEDRQLVENHVRRAFKKKGNKDNWQENQRRKNAHAEEKSVQGQHERRPN
jgi:hypothetical protein